MLSIDTINTLITIAGSIVGAVIGAVAILRKNDKSSETPSNPIFWITIGAIVGAIATLSILALIGFLPIGPVLNSALYDDFNNSDYDGDVNRRLWASTVNPPNYIEQARGYVTFSIEPKSGQVASLFAQKKLRLNRDVFVQSKMVLSGRMEDGAYVDTGLALVTTDEKGKSFISLCVIARLNFVEIWCEVYGRTTYGPEYKTETFFTDYDTWHTVRIEIAQDVSITFFIDEKEIGLYQPADAQVFVDNEFTVRLEAFTDKQDGIISHFDDVMIGNK